MGANNKDHKPEETQESAPDEYIAHDHSSAVPVADPLSRRSFLSRVGASTAAVAAVTAAGLPRFSLMAAPNLDWNAIAKLSAEAFRVAVNEWIGQARVQGGRVSGSAAILPAGSLVSNVNIAKRMVDMLSASQVPPAISTAVANVLAGAWQEWAVGFQNANPRRISIARRRSCTLCTADKSDGVTCAVPREFRGRGFSQSARPGKPVDLDSADAGFGRRRRIARPGNAEPRRLG